MLKYDVFAMVYEKKVVYHASQIVWPFLFVSYGLFFVHELKLGY